MKLKRHLPMPPRRALTVLMMLAFGMAGCSSGNAPGASGAKAGSCPLSLVEQRRAAADFEAMMPALAHPRCANCHGGIDVFAPSAKQLHGGGQIDMKTVTNTQDAEFGLGHAETIKEQDFSSCEGCHEVHGWRLPPSNLFFAGRSPLQICHQFKHSGPGPFKTHVTQDALVLAGFEGRRGQSDLSPKPPPITHAAFQKAALDWVALVGDGSDWKGGGETSDCGCVAPSGQLRITDRITESSDRYGMEKDLTYRAVLSQDDKGDFKGSGTYSGSLTTRKLNCHNTLPDHPQAHLLQGYFKASATLAAFGDTQWLNFNFDTTDWPIELTPFGMFARGKPSADDVEAAGHGGSILGLMEKIHGAKTVIHHHHRDDGRADHMGSCVKWVDHDEVITVEQLDDTGAVGG